MTKRNPKTRVVTCTVNKEDWKAFEQLARVMGHNSSSALRELVAYAIENTSFDQKHGRGPFAATSLAYGAATVRAMAPKEPEKPKRQARGTSALKATQTRPLVDLKPKVQTKDPDEGP